MDHPQSTPPTTNIGNILEETSPKKGWRMFLEYAGNWLAHKNKSEWLKDMRGNLSLVATMIATMTFQVAVNPPGGVMQASNDANIDRCSYDNNGVRRACPGEAVLGALYSNEYFNFILYNTISFVASLSVCLLLVSGLPLNHRFPMWLLSIGMCITLTSLGLTYLYGASMVTPDPVWDPANDIFGMVLKIWIGLLGTVGLFLTIRFAVWGVNKYVEKRNTPRASGNNMDRD